MKFTKLCTNIACRSVLQRDTFYCYTTSTFQSLHFTFTVKKTELVLQLLQEYSLKQIFVLLLRWWMCVLLPPFMCARVCLLKVEAETWQWLIAWLRSNKHSLIKSSDSVKVYVSWESRGWTLCVNFHYYSTLITAACLSCKCEWYEMQLLLQLLGVNKNNFTIMAIFKDPFGRKCKRVTLNGWFCITVFHSQTQCFVCLFFHPWFISVVPKTGHNLG